MKITLLGPHGRLPTRATPDSAGLDVYATESFVLRPMERRMIDLEFAIELDRSSYAQVAPRSGLAVKYGLTVLAGVIDSDYRGSVRVVLMNLGSEPYSCAMHDKIAQLIVVPCALPVPYLGRDLSVTARGTKGFGSSGK